MPAPTQIEIRTNLVNSLLQAGYYKKSYNQNNQLVTDITKIPDELEKLVDTLSTGIAKTWTEYHAKTTITGMAGSIPVTGKLV